MWLRVAMIVCLALLALPMSGVRAAPGGKSCTPNPNLNAPPFVDGCPVPASTLNRLFQGAYGGLGPGVHTCATVTVNDAGYIQSVVSGTCGSGPPPTTGIIMTGGTNLLTGGTNLLFGGGGGGGGVALMTGGTGILTGGTSLLTP